MNAEPAAIEASGAGAGGRNLPQNFSLPNATRLSSDPAQIHTVARTTQASPQGPSPDTSAAAATHTSPRGSARENNAGTRRGFGARSGRGSRMAFTRRLPERAVDRVDIWRRRDLGQGRVLPRHRVLRPGPPAAPIARLAAEDPFLGEPAAQPLEEPLRSRSANPVRAAMRTDVHVRAQPSGGPQCSPSPGTAHTIPRTITPGVITTGATFSACGTRCRAGDAG